MRLGYFEKVRVSNSRELPKFNGRTGVVLGISEEGGKVYGYDVHFAEEAEGYFFPPEELTGTGQFVDRRDFYDDKDKIRIRVDVGRGRITHG